nr:MAG TPA: hypothetical protein [Caudoviricetes sp.]
MILMELLIMQQALHISLQTQCSKLANKHCVFIPTSEYTEQCRS